MNVEQLHSFAGHFASVYCLLAKDRAAGTFLTGGGDGHIVEWGLNEPDKGQVIATVEGRIFSLFYWKSLLAQEDPSKGLGSLVGQKTQQWHDAEVVPNAKPLNTKTSKPILVAGDMNGGIHWLDLQNGEPPIGRALHKKGVFALGVDASEKWLYSLGGDGYLGKWEIATTRATESLQLSGHSLRCFDFSIENGLAAIGASDGYIYIVILPEMRLVQVLKNAHENSVFSIKWSPDGRFLLSGGRDAQLKIWDVEQGYALQSGRPAHWFTINDIAFSPNGLHFATASRDKSFKIWGTEDFALKKVIAAPRFSAHINSVNRVLWMSDSLLLSAGDDRAVLAWEVA